MYISFAKLMVGSIVALQLKMFSVCGLWIRKGSMKREDMTGVLTVTQGWNAEGLISDMEILKGRYIWEKIGRQIWQDFDFGVWQVRKRH